MQKEKAEQLLAACAGDTCPISAKLAIVRPAPCFKLWHRLAGLYCKMPAKKAATFWHLLESTIPNAFALLILNAS
jgi:hypothetical protein